MRVTVFSASTLTRFSAPLIRRAEGRSGEFEGGLSLLSSAGKGSFRVVWMGQKVQQQHLRHVTTCADVPLVAMRNGGESFRNPLVEGTEDAVVKHGKSSLVVVSFYKFAALPDYAEMRTPLREVCDAHVRFCIGWGIASNGIVEERVLDLCSLALDIHFERVSGGIILTPEGINGSICGSRESVENVFATLQSDLRLKDLRRNEAPATEEEEDLHHGQTQKSPLGAGDDAPFRRGHVRVKLKNEVVPLGVPGVKPSEKVGTYVKPKDWNDLISDPKTVVIDVRNDYEVRIGKFKGAVDPKTEAFREFLAWAENRFGLSPNKWSGVPGASVNDGQSTSKVGVEQNSVHSQVQPQRIAMYCTGGIRCEKATSYLMDKGVSEVYHLEGGILKYLEQVTPAESLWEGECFVFDKRVSVDHGLKQGTHSLCYACKKPVNDDDKLSPLWEEGVSCPYCCTLKSQEEKERARARQIQFRATGVIGGPDNGRRQAQGQQIQQSA